MNTESLDLSVVIITLNEENNLRQCLKALPQGAEIVVLDSGSSDQTLNIAREFGAQVSHREFDHYSGQKNAALEHASRKWILSLDADEVLDDALRASIISVVQGGGQPHIKGYRLARHLVFLGRQLRFGKTRDYPLRMFLRHEEHVFSSPIHEKISINPAQVAVLPGSLLHFSYDSLSDYFSRFNLYTSKIAENHFSTQKVVPTLFTHGIRPWIEFINRYFLRLGFLDGYQGYCYALFSSLYAFVKYAKLRELSRGKEPTHEIK